MKSSFLPGWAHIQAKRSRRLASFCHSSPGILPRSEPLPCTTSSWERGSTKFSVNGVHGAEGELVVVELAEDGVAREVGERVVHPAHVPLEAEPEPAHVGRARDHGPRGRLLGHGLDVGVLAVDVLVEPAQEGDRLEVLPAPVGVRHPLARLARVVEVQHRGHRVHPQAVGVEDVEPEHRARQQEAADLVAPVVEDEAVPVGVVALAAVGVLVEVRPVEVGEPVLVGREVGRNPVEDDPDPPLVERVHEVHEVLGGAVAAGGGEVARGSGSPTSRRRGAPSAAGAPRG